MTRGPRTAIAAGLAGTALIAAIGAAVPAQAASPTYTCDRTYVGHKDKGWGWLNCAAANGAPERGAVHGSFRIASRKTTDPAFTCTERPPENYPSGQAELPDRIVGFSCTHS